MSTTARASVRAVAVPRRAIAIVRVSKERDEMSSPEIQRHAIESYAGSNRITIIDWVEGIDESGSRAKSSWWPRLFATIDRVEAGEANTIIMWKFSRTGRHRLKWAIALDRMDVLGAELLSVTEPIESRTASGKFARGMLGEVNAYQADLIGEAWRETLERRVRQGLPGTGRPRFGYVWDREGTGQYTPNLEIAPLVREMYRRYIAGNGMASVARWLNEQGQRSRNGTEWQTIGVARYMDRGFAAGLIWSKGVLHPGAHEAIIDRETWDAYLARRASTNQTPRGAVRMLSGLMKCGSCGGPMMAVRGSLGYGCGKHNRGRSCDAPVHISTKLAERRLTEWITQLPARTMYLREAADREEKQRVTMIEDRVAISRRMRRTEERLASLTIRLVDGKISEAAYDVAAIKLNGELADLKDRFALAAPRPRSDLLSELPAIAEGWAELSPAAQNRAARTLIDRIVVERGSAEDRMKIIPRWETN